MAIPLVDLSAQHRSIQKELDRAIRSVVESGAFILGPQVAEFEEAFARFIGARHCVGVACGLDALRMILTASGVGPGDEVILPANTFIATAFAVTAAGATPVLVDCEERFLQIDPGRIERAITPRTRAIMPVHLYGQCADMEAVGDVARRRGLLVVEDAAQAHGAGRSGRKAGTFGLAAAFSFYPAKNLGALGDGGAVVTDDEALASRVSAMRDYGQSGKYRHVEKGLNSRLDTLQAAVLSVKLKRLAEWNEARRRVAGWYSEELSAVRGARLPEAAPGNEHVWHLYVVRTPRRDEVLKRLQAAGIGAGIHYPIPIHLQPAYKELGLGPGSFPVAEKASGEILSLPMYPEMTRGQVADVAKALKKALA